MEEMRAGSTAECNLFKMCQSDVCVHGLLKHQAVMPVLGNEGYSVSYGNGGIWQSEALANSSGRSKSGVRNKPWRIIKFPGSVG
jgi:hypothetical protein